MPNPKRRHSKARKNRRRAHDHLSLPGVSECPHCHESKPPHHACPHCGYYRARQAVLVDENA
ncbi:MAG: 50S ribosomal protein L32 [Terriglobia bacterium]